MPRPRLIGTLAMIATAGLIAVSSFARPAEPDPQVESEHLRREAELLLREADRLEMEAHDDERRALERRLDEERAVEMVMNEVQELRAQGRDAEAERIAHEVDAYMAEAERAYRAEHGRAPRARPRDRDRDREIVRGNRERVIMPERETRRVRGTEAGARDMESRVHHLQIASEHLEAAGMPDAADRLRAHAERLIDELHAAHAGETRRPAHRRGAQPSEHDDAVDSRIAELEVQLRDLREHVRVLTEIVEKLQDEVEAKS